ncbi:MAG TPA: hypothetical protein VIJ57_13715 [Hanamia sp.]
MVFTHSEYLDKQSKAEIMRQTPGLEFHSEYRFPTGIDGQIAAFVPLDSYFIFVKDERIFEGISAHNYELTLKGRSAFKKGHNYDFVRFLLEY